MRDSSVFRVVVALAALVALVGIAVMAAACTAYKTRDTDPNAGGGSMYRAADTARTR